MSKFLAIRIRPLLQRFAFATLCFFSSCSHPQQWAFQRIDAGDQQFNSTKLTYHSQDPINGIDLELMQTPNLLRSYLNVHSLPIPSLKDDPKATAVNLCIGDNTYQFLARRHEGGQRLVLPQEMTEKIIEGLLQHLPLKIKVPGYAVVIEAEGFEEKFQQLGHTPLFRNPFHLPF